VYKVEADAAKVLPPCQGSIVAVNVSSSVQLVDLTTIPACKAMPGGMPDQTNPISHYVRITVNGSNDLFFAFGNNATTLATLSPTSYTTVASNGKVTLTNNECDYIVAGSFKAVIAVASGTPQTQNPKGGSSPARYLALVTASGNTIARIYQSGP
jgi:hypothetical protein